MAMYVRSKIGIPGEKETDFLALAERNSVTLLWNDDDMLDEVPYKNYRCVCPTENFETFIDDLKNETYDSYLHYGD